MLEIGVIIDYAASLAVLTVLELVLGVDNLIFIAITSNRLPKPQQKSARRLGLLLALVTRIILLLCAFWLIHLEKPFLTIGTFGVSGRDLFLLFGGLFLLYKATREIHNEFSQEEQEASGKKFASFSLVVIQIAILDIIFSLDSVITAVGMTNNFWIMAAAITIAIAAMIFLAEGLSAFVSKYPTVRMLAFSFLIMVGMVLVADGLHFYIPRGYIYFATAFSIFVEFLNVLRRRKRTKSTG